MVLLKNDDSTLPLDPTKKTAVIGPLGDDQHDMLGPWWGQGEDEDAVSVLDGIKAQSPGHDVRPGLHAASNIEPPATTPRRRLRAPTPASPTAVAAAKAADQVVLALGETREMSGEAAARSHASTCPGQQQELIDAIKATGKPFVVVLFNGRPLTLGDGGGERRRRSSRPGSRASRPATRSPTCCSGRSNPGGKLPVSFPQRLGQVPIYYNHEPTGRPVRRRPRSTTRATATCAPATRCTRSATG